jgi:hypothetical protein
MKQLNYRLLQIIIVSVFFLSEITISFCQIYTGGNMGMNYNNGVYIDFAPVLGYRKNRAEFGISPFYSYSKINNASSATYTYGGRIFTKYTLFEGLFLHAELEASNIGAGDINRNWVLAMPIGAGYSKRIGNITTYATILYNVILINKLNTTFTKENPVIRAGVNYDF